MKAFEQAWALLKAFEDQRVRQDGPLFDYEYQQTTHPAIGAYTQRHLGMSPGMASATGQLEMGGDKYSDTIHRKTGSRKPFILPMSLRSKQRTREEGTPHEALREAMKEPMVDQDMGDLPEEYSSSRPRLPEEVVDPMFMAQDRNPFFRVQHPTILAASLDDDRSREFRRRLAESRGQ